MENLLNELRRRNIIRVAGVYVGVSWLVIQLGIALETSLNLPSWFDTFVTTFVLLGFPIAMIITWAFEVTPDGIQRTPKAPGAEAFTKVRGRSSGIIVMAILAVLMITVSWQMLGNNKIDTVNNSEIVPLDSDLNTPIIENISDISPSIAVLAFADFSPDKDQGYFADGISEELLNILAKIDGLQVTSRTSAFSFKDKNVPISEIAKLLGVTYVLEGSIRKAGKMLRITAQLIDTKNDVHIWSETYDRALNINNIFNIQDEISTAIVTELKGKLGIITIKNTIQPKSLLAYELYLRARNNMFKRQPATMEIAVRDFQKAIELDPKFAAAYAGLAEVFLLSISYREVNKLEAIAMVKPLLRRAKELAPRSLESLIVTATLAYYEEDWPKVIRLSNEALAINPNSSHALVRLSNGYDKNGDPKKAVEALRKAQLLSPLDKTIIDNLAFLYLRLGQQDAVKQIYENYLSINPDFQMNMEELGFMELLVGNYGTAHRYWVKGDSPFILDELAKLYQNVGLHNLEIAGVGDENKARLLIAKGDFDGAKELLSQITDLDLQIMISYLARDFDQALNFASNTIDSYSDNLTLPGISTVYEWTLIYGVIMKSGHKNGDIISAKLGDFFENISGSEFSYSDGIMAAAMFYALNGDEESVYFWLNRFIDLGHSTYLLIDPAFDALRNSKRFISIKEGNSRNSTRHRVIIQAQLDSLS